MATVQHLLVDGSNVIHAWPELRPLLRRDRVAARRRLTQLLSPLHDSAGLRVTIVFDGRGAALEIERPFEVTTFSVLLTPEGTTADDVIERLVAQAADPATCLVATGDAAEQQTVAALGAGTLTPADLAAWLDRTVSRQSATLARRRPGPINAHPKAP